MKTSQLFPWLSTITAAFALPREQIHRPSITSEAIPSSSSTTPSEKCSVSQSSPSVAPMRVFRQNPTGNDDSQQTSPDVWISPENSTTFEYTAVPNFPEGSTCALQFRMPFCSELPRGYPCYRFSGLEHEILSGAGLSFSMAHRDASSRWDDEQVHHIVPGDKTIIGTFSCDSLKSPHDGDTSLSWISHSVSGFQLGFMQAGMGDDAEFNDGVGAWIVQCQS